MAKALWAKWKSVKPRQKRMYLYLAILLGVLGWKVIPRPWFPTVTLETAHHIVYSTATREQAQDTAQKMELLYQAYSNVFGTLPKFQRGHPKLKVNLFKDRKEFRWINPGLGWAEAYYRFP
ncbi:MAG: putative lipoprotein [Verrucomicrobiales bacterium]|nr:putative lipoprotein [Verrucomicrobiales bacterium]